MEHATIRLPDDMHAEIDDEQGKILLIQDSAHVITMTPEQAYWFVVWVVDNHLNFLDYKAHETPEPPCCFECGEVIEQGEDHEVIVLPEGDVALCSRCAATVEAALPGGLVVREEMGELVPIPLALKGIETCKD